MRKLYTYYLTEAIISIDEDIKVLKAMHKKYATDKRDQNFNNKIDEYIGELEQSKKRLDEMIAMRNRLNRMIMKAS